MGHLYHGYVSHTVTRGYFLLRPIKISWTSWNMLALSRQNLGFPRLKTSVTGWCSKAWLREWATLMNSARFTRGYPLVMTNIAIENLFIVDFPIKNGDFPNPEKSEVIWDFIRGWHWDPACCICPNGPGLRKLHGSPTRCPPWKIEPHVRHLKYPPSNLKRAQFEYIWTYLAGAIPAIIITICQL